MLVALAAVVVAGYCFTLPWTYGAWVSMFGIVSLYPVACVLHVRFHFRASRAVVNRPSLLGLMVLSHAALVAAFLLQWDTGDGPDWLILTAMTGSGPGYSDSDPPGWWPRDALGIVLNVLLFVPVAMTWRKLRHAHG